MASWGDHFIVLKKVGNQKMENKKWEKGNGDSRKLQWTDEKPARPMVTIRTKVVAIYIACGGQCSTGYSSIFLRQLSGISWNFIPPQWDHATLMWENDIQIRGFACRRGRGLMRALSCEWWCHKRWWKYLGVT